ncbi:MAG: hypothetical protein R2813_13500 [Flavobacteriales bacterium]
MKILVGICALLLGVNGMAQFPRTVLLEVSESVYRTESEFSICAKEGLLASFSRDQLVVMSHHWDDLRLDSIDPFFKDFSKRWAKSYGFNNWKTASLDRIALNDSSTALGAGFWDDTLYHRLGKDVAVKVALPEVLYDPNYNEIYLRINAEFGADISNLGDLRIHCYVVANGLTHNQLINDEKNGICNTFKDPLDTFKVKVMAGDTYYFTGRKDFKHNNVPIQSPTGFEGEKELFPNDVKAGNQFNLVKRFPKPSGFNLSDLYVVAFLAMHTDSIATGNEVWNATQSIEFLAYDQDNPNDPNHPDNPDNPNSVYYPVNWPDGINGPGKHHSLHIFPNPLSGLGFIEYCDLDNQPVSFAIKELNGDLVKLFDVQEYNESCARHEFFVSDISPGIYMLEFQTDKDYQHILISVVR